MGNLSTYTTSSFFNDLLTYFLFGFISSTAGDDEGVSDISGGGGDISVGLTRLFTGNAFTLNMINFLNSLNNRLLA